MALPYYGSKRRLATCIVTCILNSTTKRQYVEPFCGMAYVALEMMESKSSDVVKYRLNDLNENVYVYMKALSNGWVPTVKLMTQEKWDSYKDVESPSAQRTFDGICLGHYGRFLSGRDIRTKPDRNKLSVLKGYAERVTDAMKILSAHDVEVTQLSFADVEIKDSIIYCDPPYIGTESASRGYKKKMYKEEDMFKVMAAWLLADNDVYLSLNRIPESPMLEFSVLYKTDYKGKIHNKKRCEYLFKVSLTK